MKKCIFTTLALIGLTTLASAFTLQDCYQHTTYYGEDKGYFWFITPSPVKLEYTVSGLENSPEFVSYLYDLEETYPGNYEWGTYELTFSEYIYPVLVTTEPGHGYGMEINGYDENYNNWYWNSTYDMAMGYWTPTWSADGNTVTFLNNYSYSSDFQITVKMGTPLPVAPLAMGLMSLFSVPVMLRRRKTV